MAIFEKSVSPPPSFVAIDSWRAMSACSATLMSDLVCVSFSLMQLSFTTSFSFRACSARPSTCFRAFFIRAMLSAAASSLSVSLVPLARGWADCCAPADDAISAPARKIQRFPRIRSLDSPPGGAGVPKKPL